LNLLGCSRGQIKLNNTARKRLIQKYYSRRARDYDAQKSRTWKNAQGFGAEVVKELSSAIATCKNGLVLEVGIGSGRNAMVLLKKIKLHIVGVDISKEMLKLAKAKMTGFGRSLSLVLGDIEHLPFSPHIFDALVCMSTMHYSPSTEEILNGFHRILKNNGVIVYGDLTIHETDDKEFLERLENTVSKVHAKYHKPSEIKQLLEKSVFQVSRMKTISYRKAYRSLLEDKAEYFNVSPTELDECIHGADAGTRKKYALSNNELTLYYTIIVAVKD